jgi:hypothetical protein
LSHSVFKAIGVCLTAIAATVLLQAQALADIPPSPPPPPPDEISIVPWALMVAGLVLLTVIFVFGRKRLFRNKS